LLLATSVVDDAAAVATGDADGPVVVAREIRSADAAVVGPVAGRKLPTEAGNDVVLSQFVDVDNREPADDVTVVVETSASMSELTLSEMSPRAPAVDDWRGTGPDTQDQQHSLGPTFSQLLSKITGRFLTLEQSLT